MYHFRTYQAKTENYLEENFHILRVDFFKGFFHDGHENDKHHIVHHHGKRRMSLVVMTFEL